MLDLYHFVRATHGWIFQLWACGMGACVGSFLNVCVLRLPAGQSIVRPGSHCACGQPIRFYDNIPILSWFILGGKARCCGRRFSFRYPLVEAVTAGAFLWLWSRQPAPVALAGMVFFSLLFLGALIDLDHMTLPDVSTVGGMLVGVVLSCVWPQIQVRDFVPSGFWLGDALHGWTLAVIGILVGTGVVFWLRELGELILKKEAMGYGDILLMGCIGAFCGWQGALFAIFGGAVLGSLVILPWMIGAWMFRKPGGKTRAPFPMNSTAGPEAKEPEAGGTPAFGVAIPFGPWLALAGFLYYAWLWPWVNAYFDKLRIIVFELPLQS
ncbi:MAG: prepilin peptidase [Opitutales bacterium]|jgi:leader peptidase (prepilin peptidase)/N-methyltransferase